MLPARSAIDAREVNEKRERLSAQPRFSNTLSIGEIDAFGSSERQQRQTSVRRERIRNAKGHETATRRGGVGLTAGRCGMPPRSSSARRCSSWVALRRYARWAAGQYGARAWSGGAGPSTALHAQSTLQPATHMHESKSKIHHVSCRSTTYLKPALEASCGLAQPEEIAHMRGPCQS